MGGTDQEHPPHPGMKGCFTRALKNEETLVEQSRTGKVTLRGERRLGEVPG